jgi:hypothetical protein
LPGSRLKLLLEMFINGNGNDMNNEQKKDADKGECERCKEGKGDPFISEYYKNKK